MIAFIVIGGLGIVCFVAMIYACCVAAGYADRQAERIWLEEEEGEEEPTAVWNGDERRYSGLLEEDDE